MITIQKYVRAQSLEEAWQLIQTAQRKNDREIIAHAAEQGEHQQVHC